MPKYQYLGDHAGTICKGDKVIPVGQFDSVDLTEKDLQLDGNKVLVDEGLLVKESEVNKDA